jgi:diacylglycerol kinase (ATP)
MKKALVIFNPTAGLKSKIDVEGLVHEKLDNLGYEVDLIYLNREFEVNIEGYDFSDIMLIVAVGGDGTVKVAARTIIQNKVKASLAIVPFGSANVIAVAAGIPTNIKGALKLLEKAKKTISIDVGLINDKHYFIVGFSVGYISKIVTGATKDMKNKFGFWGYLFMFLFNKIKIRKVKFEIKTKEKTFWVKGNSLVVFNALNYYGFKIKKYIDFSDGIFNLYVFTNKTFLSLVESFLLMVLYRRPPRYVWARDNNYFKILLKKPSDACQIDGDYVKLPKVIEVKVLPKALSLVVVK